MRRNSQNRDRTTSIGHYQDPADEVRKVGSVRPRTGIRAIIHRTLGNHEVHITGLVSDPDDPNSLFATRYVHDLETGAVEEQFGRVIGPVTETGEYGWEEAPDHKLPVRAALAVLTTVAIGSLVVHYKHKSE